MNKSELQKFLRLEGEAVGLDDDLFEEGLLDSLAVVELLEVISKRSGIPIEALANDLSRVSNLTKILQFFESDPPEEHLR